MATLNLYVSDELKRQMSELELNWSRIAAEAIATVINLERTKEMNVEQASIERLRASMAKVKDQRQAEGVALGKQWAADAAEYDELERLTAIPEVALNDDEQSAWAARALAGALLDDENPSWDDVKDALQPIFGTRLPRDTEVIGFIAGATEIFEQI